MADPSVSDRAPQSPTCRPTPREASRKGSQCRHLKTPSAHHGGNQLLSNALLEDDISHRRSPHRSRKPSIPRTYLLLSGGIQSKNLDLESVVILLPPSHSFLVPGLKELPTLNRAVRLPVVTGHLPTHPSIRVRCLCLERTGVVVKKQRTKKQE